MKLISLTLSLISLQATAQSTGYLNFIRQNQQQTGVVWDMPVGPKGSSPAVMPLENGGSLFQLWAVRQSDAKSYLLDQKVVGAYLPKAKAKVTTLDPDGAIPRTRVDQPFVLEIDVSDLLTGLDLPEASSKVLLEHHIHSYTAGQGSLAPVDVISNTPINSVYIATNGPTHLKFPASALHAADPTKASGEEHFVVHVLADGDFGQTQIASASVQVWPIASGSIHGIIPGMKYRYQVPAIQLTLDDLYPRSDTSLMLYPGTEINGVEGKIIQAFPMDRDTCESHILKVEDFGSQLGEDGAYTVALMSTTVYGTELLCDPITFSIKRSIAVNAMQVNFQTDDWTP